MGRLAKLGSAAVLLLLFLLFFNPNTAEDTENSKPELSIQKKIVLTTSEIYQQADYVAHLEVFVKGIESPFGMSGFVIKEENESKNKFYIVTAGHIRAGSFEITKITAYLKLDCGAQKMELLGYDMETDVALLKFKDEKFKFSGKPAVLGNSSDLKEGEKVIAMGSPLSIRFYVSEGIISKIADSNNKLFNKSSLIMHTAMINPGNSGGPLINQYGEVIGMNVMVHGDRFDNRVTSMPIATKIDFIKDAIRNLKE